MRIKIKTASKNADVSVLLVVKTENEQIVFLIYTFGQYILLEHIGANILSPLFTITEAMEVEKIFKLNNFEKDIVKEVEITKLPEETMIKILKDIDEFNIFYQKNDEYYDLVKFNKTNGNEELTQNFLNIPQNMLVMQPVDISIYFELDSILEKISKIGITNITKYEKSFLEKVSNQ
jgi:hypothetical protein